MLGSNYSSDEEISDNSQVNNTINSSVSSNTTINNNTSSKGDMHLVEGKRLPSINIVRTLIISGISTLCGFAPAVAAIGASSFLLDNWDFVRRALQKHKIKNIAKQLGYIVRFFEDKIIVTHKDGSQLTDEEKDKFNIYLKNINSHNEKYGYPLVTIDSLENAFIFRKHDNYYTYSPKDLEEYTDQAILIANEEEANKGYDDLLKKIIEYNPWIRKYIQNDEQPDAVCPYFISIPNPEDIKLPEGLIYKDNVGIIDENFVPVDENNEIGVVLSVQKEILLQQDQEQGQHPSR